MPSPTRTAWRGLLVTALLVAATLAALSTRYGYHRDELYFLACGRHLAWGYPDQPPLVPFLARVMSDISPGSMLVLRLPACLAAAWSVWGTGALAHEFGASRRGQLLAATTIGVSNILLATGHLLSTTTFLLATTVALCLIAARALRTGQSWWWAMFGLVAGVGLLNSDLTLLIGGGIVAGVLLIGPRRALLSWPAVIGLAAAALLWTPYLVWQARHGWPQLDVARAISHGGSGTSAPRWQIPVMQFVLCSPPLVPVWVAGLVALLRGSTMRAFRAFGAAYLLVLAALLVVGGKPYYLAVMFPLLVAAGSEPVLGWLVAGSRRVRRSALVTAIALAAVADAIITLPILPADELHATPIVAMDYDVGETVGWPTYVQQITSAYRRLPTMSRAQSVIVTRNYGEAGAIERYGRGEGLPSVYSGHDAFWLWGPPQATVRNVLAVGMPKVALDAAFLHVVQVGTLDNGLGIDDDEQGVPLWACSGLRAPWATIWPSFRRYA